MAVNLSASKCVPLSASACECGINSLIDSPPLAELSCCFNETFVFALPYYSWRSPYPDLVHSIFTNKTVHYCPWQPNAWFNGPTAYEKSTYSATVYQTLQLKFVHHYPFWNSLSVCLYMYIRSMSPSLSAGSDSTGAFCSRAGHCIESGWINLEESYRLQFPHVRFYAVDVFQFFRALSFVLISVTSAHIRCLNRHLFWV